MQQKEVRGAVAIVGRPATKRPDIVRVLEKAIEAKRRVRAAYQGLADDEPRERMLEPIEIRVHEAQTYLMAFDVEEQRLKTF